MTRRKSAPSDTPLAPPTRKPGRSIVDQRRTPWGLVATVAALVLFAGTVVAIAVSHGHHGKTKSSTGEVLPATPAGPVTIDKGAKRVVDASGIAGVLAWDTTGWPGDGSAHAGALEHQHVAGPVRYAILPPVGGPHAATWMNAGVYTEPVPSERAIHNLEHGAVWITYNPNISASQVAALVAFVVKQKTIVEPPAAAGTQSLSNRYLDLSPWVSSTLPSPIVISAWGHQLRLRTPDDPRLQKFVDTFRHSRIYSPEYGESVDGVPAQVGGVPATP